MNRTTLDKITLQGFRSFSNKQSFNLSTLPFPALIFVSGQNEVDQELEGNGAGKSTLFAAIQYALFGRTLEIKGTDLKSWKSKQRCFVQLHFNNGMVLTRQRDPNKLILSIDGKDETATDQQLQEIFGCNLDSFGYSVYVSQFSRKFMDLSSTEKMSLFDSIMQDELQIWERLSDKAKSVAAAMEDSVDAVRHNISQCEGRLQAWQETDYSEQIKAWDDQHKLALIEVIENIEKSESKIKDFEEGLKEKESSLHERTASSSKAVKELVRFEIELDKVKGEKHKLAAEISVINKEIDTLNGLKRHCPTCKGVVSVSVVASERLKLEKQGKGKVKELEGLKTQIKQLEDAYTEVKNKVNTLQTIVNDCNATISNFNIMLNTEKRAFADLKQRQKQIEAEKNPYKDKQQEVKGKIIDIKRQMRDLKSELSDKQEEVEIYRYWQKAYKEVRLIIVEQAIGSLEVGINDYMSRLGLNDGWTIKLEMDRETKSKSIQKGFMVMVSSPDSDGEYVPFEVWSGGEGQRLRLAGTLALIDFIHDRRGSDFDFEVWDEPTQWLSESGIEDLLEVLKDRAYEQKRRLFVIDHRDFASLGDFDHHLKINKTLQGSIIV